MQASLTLSLASIFTSVDCREWVRNPCRQRLEPHRGIDHASTKLLVKGNIATSLREFDKNRQGANVSRQLVPTFAADALCLRPSHAQAQDRSVHCPNLGGCARYGNAP